MFLLISTENNSHFSVCLGDEDNVIIKTVEKPYQQSELLLKTIVDLTSKATKKVKKIIVVSGPGQFSALRIGIATANTLSYAWQVPVVGIKLKKQWLELSEREKLQKAWLDSIKKSNVKFKKNVFKFVKPFYGSEPNIS